MINLLICSFVVVLVPRCTKRNKYLSHFIEDPLITDIGFYSILNDTHIKLTENTCTYLRTVLKELRNVRGYVLKKYLNGYIFIIIVVTHTEVTKIRVLFYSTSFESQRDSKLVVLFSIYLRQ